MESVGIVGLGALGVLFGERLLSCGADVRILVDEERAARYRREGVTCNGRPVNFSYVTPAEAAPVDLLIFATKAGGLRGAMETAAPFVGPKTLLLSVLNGISSEEELAARFGPQNVLYATAQGMDAVRVGRALTYAHAGVIVLGEKTPGTLSPRVQRVAEFLNAYGVSAQPVEDMVRRQWGKLMLNVGVNQAVMVFEGDYGTVQQPGKARDAMIGAMREVQALSKLEGYPISDAELAQWVALVDSLSPSGKPSMRQDAEALRKSEVELFAGTILRRAERFGLDVPVNRWLYETIKTMEAAYASGEKDDGQQGI